MDKKTFVKTNTEGKILAVVTSNDPTLVFNETEIVMEITDDNKLKEIVENSKHFKLESEKVVEMTQTEKEKVDKDLEIKPPTNPIFEALQKINDRLDKIENDLKIKYQIK